MNIRINIRSHWHMVLLCAALLGMASATFGNEVRPADLVQETAGNLLEQIDQRRDEFRENPDALKALVHTELMPLLDQIYSARLILGRHGRGIEPEKIEKFAEALGNLLTDRYSTGLLEFRSNEQMEIMPPNPNDNERLTRVRTRIRLQNGGAAPVDYSFRKTEAGWKVFDVTVEGVSYVMTFRNQLGPRVASEGIDAVTADLMAGRIEVTGS